MANSSIGQAIFIILIFIILILINVMYIHTNSLESHWSNYECSQLYLTSLFGSSNSSQAFANCIQNIQDTNFVSFSTTNNENITLNNNIIKTSNSANKGLDKGIAKNTKTISKQANDNTNNLSKDNIIAPIQRLIQTELSNIQKALSNEFSSKLFKGNTVLKETGSEFTKVHSIIDKTGLGKIHSFGSALKAIHNLM